MAVPKGRVSKSKRDKRKAQSWKIATPSLVACSKCGELMMPHRVCKACLLYTSLLNFYGYVYIFCPHTNDGQSSFISEDGTPTLSFKIGVK